MLQNRISYFEDQVRNDTRRTAEGAVRALIDFEEDAGPALTAAMAEDDQDALPDRSRKKEEDFTSSKYEGWAIVRC